VPDDYTNTFCSIPYPNQATAYVRGRLFNLNLNDAAYLGFVDDGYSAHHRATTRLLILAAEKLYTSSKTRLFAQHQLHIIERDAEHHHSHDGFLWVSLHLH
jgi:hypothetical protein